MSAPYLGDYTDDETVHFMWSSNDSNGASITRSTDGEVRVYRDNGVTQTTTGVTDTEDFDSLTGVHVCTIATTDSFYETAADFTVVLQGATIDTRTVNAVLAHFSIENRFMRGTNSASLASVVGALDDTAADGDPTTGDTSMQYLKQLINVLMGTAGIVAWPTAAAPGNGVSIAEALRAAYDDTNSLDGTKIPNTLSLANINTECDTALTDYNAVIPADLGFPQINTAFSNIPFMMVLTSDHVSPATGLTVTGERSLNAGSFSAVSGSIAEISNGWYQFDAASADMNGVTVAFRFSAGTADDTGMSFITRA